MTVVRPPAWRRVLYGYGARLDERFLPWVTRDLSGRGAGSRMVARWSIPCLVLLSPFMVLPTDWVVKAMMTVPILLPYVYFSIALNRVYRRHRLAQHGLDPALVDARERERNRPSEEAYLSRYRGA